MVATFGGWVEFTSHRRERVYSAYFSNTQKLVSHCTLTALAYISAKYRFLISRAKVPFFSFSLDEGSESVDSLCNIKKSRAWESPTPLNLR